MPPLTAQVVRVAIQKRLSLYCKGINIDAMNLLTERLLGADSLIDIEMTLDYILRKITAPKITKEAVSILLASKVASDEAFDIHTALLVFGSVDNIIPVVSPSNTGFSQTFKLRRNSIDARAGLYADRLTMLRRCLQYFFYDAEYVAAMQEAWGIPYVFFAYSQTILMSASAKKAVNPPKKLLDDTDSQPIDLLSGDASPDELAFTQPRHPTNPSRGDNEDVLAPVLITGFLSSSAKSAADTHLSWFLEDIHDRVELVELPLTMEALAEEIPEADPAVIDLVLNSRCRTVAAYLLEESIVCAVGFRRDCIFHYLFVNTLPLIRSGPLNSFIQSNTTIESTVPIGSCLPAIDASFRTEERTAGEMHLLLKGDQVSFQALEYDIFGPINRHVLMPDEMQDFVVALSCVNLLEEDTFLRFEKMLSVYNGFEDAVAIPAAVILVGSFFNASDHSSSETLLCYQSLLARLFGIAVRYQSVVKRSLFVVVPGPQDVSLSGNLYPRSELPHQVQCFLRKNFEEHGLRLSFQSSPVRIRFASQQITCAASALLRTISSLHCNSRFNKAQAVEGEPPEMSYRFALTVASQRHLCPVPQSIQPTMWNLDHTLRLYPQSNIVLLCEDTQCFTHGFKDLDFCMACPGNFSADGSFLAIYAQPRNDSLVEKLKV